MTNNDTSVDDLFAADDEPKADEKPKRKPRSASNPKAATEPIDNAVRVRRLDWECPCGNTNTLDLNLCGKCRAPRYTH